MKSQQNFFKDPSLIELGFMLSHKTFYFHLVMKILNPTIIDTFRDIIFDYSDTKNVFIAYVYKFEKEIRYITNKFSIDFFFLEKSQKKSCRSDSNKKYKKKCISTFILKARYICPFFIATFNTNIFQCFHGHITSRPRQCWEISRFIFLDKFSR